MTPQSLSCTRVLILSVGGGGGGGGEGKRRKVGGRGGRKITDFKLRQHDLSLSNLVVLQSRLIYI